MRGRRRAGDRRRFGIDRLAMWGISGGGPYALACAALLPDLVIAAASLGLVGPGGRRRAGLSSRAWARRTPTTSSCDQRPGGVTPPSWKKTAAGHTGPRQRPTWPNCEDPADADRRDRADRRVRRVVRARAWHEGLAPGDQGWWDDGVAHGSPWGFELSAIEIPVLLMHGRTGPVRPVRTRPVARRPHPRRGRQAAGRRRPPHAGDEPHRRGARLAGGSPITKLNRERRAWTMTRLSA